MKDPFEAAVEEQDSPPDSPAPPEEEPGAAGLADDAEDYDGGPPPRQPSAPASHAASAAAKAKGRVQREQQEDDDDDEDQMEVDLEKLPSSTGDPDKLAKMKYKQAKFVRTKWWKLKGETSKLFKERIFVEGAWFEEDANNMWVKMATCIRKVASEVFVVIKGSRGEPKDTWWWTEYVQKAVKEKKECYRSLFHDRSTVNIERYKVAKRTAKRAVSETKGQAYDDLFRRRSTKEGDKDAYKMTRIRERKTRDLNQVKCIKDEMDQLLVKGQDIKQRWQRYFDNLFNGENETMDTQLDDPFDDLNRCFVRRIQESEVKEALKRMKGGKTMGSDGIPIEV
ncbi:hypothetical protein Zm00014a_027684 [Zea mays]|uniref:Retrovirus-related Pol polyprotein LINE-1 n=1 Tax=Zea mays TaxID=4577 RepID=A0A3L6FNP3_MAIZE|nr:hypothetical protein Zm00014a_027684 [Zea mays]